MVTTQLRPYSCAQSPQAPGESLVLSIWHAVGLGWCLFGSSVYDVDEADKVTVCPDKVTDL